MREPVKERANLAARHDFDSLPTDTESRCGPRTALNCRSWLTWPAAIVPGVQMTAPVLGRVPAFDPECILTFSRREKLLGGDSVPLSQ